jgi:glutamyl-tRNA(Gln) amidotransferase subunit D
MPKAGDRVKVVTSKETVEGILMPSSDPEAVIIKLSTGYNLGFKKKEIKKIDVLKAEKEPRQQKSPDTITLNKTLPTISILHTGGTIASKVDYKTGGVYASFTAEDFLEMFPEIKNIANIRTQHVANLMSEDIRFSHYALIAKAIEKEIKAGVKGIIIGHGTDTLAITAAALSFIFENLPVPVILVGSQRSSDRGSADAAMNLICAAEFITKTDFTGVAICMHASESDTLCHIFPATKTRKLHTSRRDAFKAVNDTPIATVDYTTRNIKFLKKYTRKSEVSGKLTITDKFEDKVAVVRTHVNMSPAILDALTKHKFKGIVLEATGIGQAPTNITENLPNYEALKKFIKQGGIVILTSQCIFGRVHPYIYTNCRRLYDIGVIFGEDMLTETVHVKLAWLLGNYPNGEVKKMIIQNLRGEINERIEFKEDFLK